MKKVILINGLISGVAVTAFMMISMALCYKNPEFEGSMVVGFASMIMAFSLIFVGIKSFRDKYNEGLISFGKAFMIGFYIALIASTLYVIGWAIEYHFFMPDFMEKYSAMQMKSMDKMNLTPIEREAQLTQMKSYAEMYKSPVFFALFTYLEILPVGLIISLIAALILKRKSNGRSSEPVSA